MLFSSEVDEARCNPSFGLPNLSQIAKQSDSELRKQYHFRPSKQGYYAWDVDRLLALAEKLQRQRVKLDSIREIDENYWFGGKDDNPTCRAIVEHLRLIEQADMSFPIILSSDGRLMDGMHRVAKALLEGRETIEVIRFSQDPEPDYEDVCPDDLPY